MKTNHLQETKEALRNGANEIERLRHQNEILAIKAQAFETFSNFVALLTPRPNQGYAPDAVWILRKLLDKLEKEEAVHSPQKSEPAVTTGAGVALS